MTFGSRGFPALKKKANPLAAPTVTTTKESGVGNPLERTSLGTADSAESAAGQVDAPSDEDLFLKAREGHRESLAVLVKRYETRLFSLLAHLTGGDLSQADDLFQETFLRAIRAAGTFDPKRKFKAWIMSIAVNLIRDRARRRKVQNEVPLSRTGSAEASGRLVAAGEDPEQTAERRDEAEKVRGALGKLTEKEREVVLLHFFQGLTLTQAAETLTIPLGTVKSRLHGALTRLKAILG